MTTLFLFMLAVAAPEPQRVPEPAQPAGPEQLAVIDELRQTHRNTCTVFDAQTGRATAYALSPLKAASDKHLPPFWETAALQNLYSAVIPYCYAFVRVIDAAEGIPVHTLCSARVFRTGMEICPTLFVLQGHPARQYTATRSEGIRLLAAVDFDEAVKEGRLLQEPLRLDDPIKTERELRRSILARARALDRHADACRWVEEKEAVSVYVPDHVTTERAPTARDQGVLADLLATRTPFCADETGTPVQVTLYALLDGDASDHDARMRMHWHAETYRDCLETESKKAGINLHFRCDGRDGRPCAEPRILGPYAPVEKVGSGKVETEDFSLFRLDLDAGLKIGDLANGRYFPDDALVLERLRRTQALACTHKDEKWRACPTARGSRPNR